MIRVKEALIVEGRYDKNTLSQIFDAVILETSGFGIYNNKERLSLLRRLSESRGIIIFTDSDGAGFQIRNFLKGAINKGRVLHAYIPDLLGKERRKSSPSKEGKLGVEGMQPEVLIEALKRSGATLYTPDCVNSLKNEALITKTDLYKLGLSGKEDSDFRRKCLLKFLELPSKLTTNSMLEVINAIMSKDEFLKIVYNSTAQ